jgi:hypothetical protein
MCYAFDTIPVVSKTNGTIRWHSVAISFLALHLHLYIFQGHLNDGAVEVVAVRNHNIDLMCFFDGFVKHN